VKVHIDGNRIFNALATTDHQLGDISQYYDSMAIGLSGSLGCPLGAVVVGS